MGSSFGICMCNSLPAIDACSRTFDSVASEIIRRFISTVIPVTLHRSTMAGESLSSSECDGKHFAAVVDPGAEVTSTELNFFALLMIERLESWMEADRCASVTMMMSMRSFVMIASSRWSVEVGFCKLQPPPVLIVIIRMFPGLYC